MKVNTARSTNVAKLSKFANMKHLVFCSECFTELFHSIFGQLFWTFVFSFSSHRSVLHYIRDFKQIATADANTAAGSKFPPKGDTAHVPRLQPAVA